MPGRGRCCTTSRRGARKFKGPTRAGTARRSASTSTATTTTTFTTFLSPLRWLASAVKTIHYTRRGDQRLPTIKEQQGEPVHPEGNSHASNPGRANPRNAG